MSDNEELHSLHTNIPKIIKLEELQKLTPGKSPAFRRKQVQNFVLYVTDSIISLVFVAPMVIAFWRGTWCLLDIHTTFFPPYATGVFGIVIHMCFVLMRQFIKDYFDEETERAKRDPMFVIARRLYTYTYSVISVMQWRGCWTAFDHWFVEDRNDMLLWTAAATILSTFALITLKSLTNSLATPCILILDSLDACYNIPTRYRIRYYARAMKDHKWSTDFGLYKFHTPTSGKRALHIPVIILAFLTMILFLIIILLLALNPTKQSVVHIPYTKKTDISNLINYNAHPFQNQIKGNVPSAFSIAKTESSITIPRNIQDVIRNSTDHEGLFVQEEHLSQQSYNPLSTPFIDYRAHDRGQHDLFHSFKPQDISEVNLLAENSVRFAPPAWVDLNDDKRKKDILRRSQRNLSARKRYRFLRLRNRIPRTKVRNVVIV